MNPYSVAAFLFLFCSTQLFSASSWSPSLFRQYLGGQGGTESQRSKMGGKTEARARKVKTGVIMERLDALLRTGKTTQALEIVNSALDVTPSELKLIIAKAAIELRLGRDGKAITAYRRALSLDAGNVYVLASLGNLLVEKGVDIEGGRTLLRRALDIQPDSALALDGLGWLAYKKSDLERAEKLFEKARLADADLPAAPYHLGLLALRKKDMARALSLFQQVVQNDPAHGRAHLSLGILYDKLGERRKAQESLGLALRLVPASGAVSRKIKKALRRLSPHWRMSDCPEVQSYGHRGLPEILMPEKPLENSIALQTTAKTDRPEKKNTVKTAVTAFRDKPLPSEALSLLPEPHSKKTARKADEDLLKEAVATSRGFVQRDLVGDHMRLGRLYYEFGLMRDAAGEFQTVINLAPLSSEARDAKDLVSALSDFATSTEEERIKGYLEVGAALFSRNDLDNAKIQYKKVLLLDPGHDVAHKNLAYLYMKEGLNNEAWSHINEALQEVPENAEALVLKAYVQARRRNFREAESTFVKVSELVRPDSRLGAYAREMAQKMALFTDLK